MAEVLLRDELEQAGLAGRAQVESAGTGDWHMGEPMDRRARAELVSRGYDGDRHRARQMSPDWIDEFDLLVAMDQRNLRSLQLMAAGRPGAAARLRLLRSFDLASPPGAEVPDPYGGGPGDFEHVFDLIKAAAKGLAAELAELLAAPGV